MVRAYVEDVQEHDDNSNSKMSSSGFLYMGQKQTSAFSFSFKSSSQDVCFVVLCTFSLLRSISPLCGLLSLLPTKIKMNPAAPMNSEATMKARCTLIWCVCVCVCV